MIIKNPWPGFFLLLVAIHSTSGGPNGSAQAFHDTTDRLLPNPFSVVFDFLQFIEHLFGYDRGRLSPPEKLSPAIMTEKSLLEDLGRNDLNDFSEIDRKINLLRKRRDAPQATELPEEFVEVHDQMSESSFISGQDSEEISTPSENDNDEAPVDESIPSVTAASSEEGDEAPKEQSDWHEVVHGIIKTRYRKYKFSNVTVVPLDRIAPGDNASKPTLEIPADRIEQYVTLRTMIRKRWSVRDQARFNIKFFEKKLEQDSEVSKAVHSWTPKDLEKLWIWSFQNVVFDYTKFENFYRKVVKRSKYGWEDEVYDLIRIRYPHLKYVNVTVLRKIAIAYYEELEGLEQAEEDVSSPDAIEKHERIHHFSVVRRYLKKHWNIEEQGSFSSEYFWRAYNEDAKFQKLVRDWSKCDLEMIWIWIYQQGTEDFAKFGKFYKKVVLVSKDDWRRTVYGILRSWYKQDSKKSSKIVVDASSSLLEGEEKGNGEPGELELKRIVKFITVRKILRKKWKLDRKNDNDHGMTYYDKKFAKEKAVILKDWSEDDLELLRAWIHQTATEDFPRFETFFRRVVVTIKVGWRKEVVRIFKSWFTKSKQDRSDYTVEIAEAPAEDEGGKDEEVSESRVDKFATIRKFVRRRWGITNDSTELTNEYFRKKLSEDTHARELVNGKAVEDWDMLWTWVIQDANEDFAQFENFYRKTVKIVRNGWQRNIYNRMKNRIEKLHEDNASLVEIALESYDKIFKNMKPARGIVQKEQIEMYSRLRRIFKLSWNVTEKEFKEHFMMKVAKDKYTQDMLRWMSKRDKEKLWIWVNQNEIDDYLKFETFVSAVVVNQKPQWKRSVFEFIKSKYAANTTTIHILTPTSFEDDDDEEEFIEITNEDRRQTFTKVRKIILRRLKLKEEPISHSLEEFRRRLKSKSFKEIKHIVDNWTDEDIEVLWLFTSQVYIGDFRKFERFFQQITRVTKKDWRRSIYKQLKIKYEKNPDEELKEYREKEWTKEDKTYCVECTDKRTKEEIIRGERLSLLRQEIRRRWKLDEGTKFDLQQFEIKISKDEHIRKHVEKILDGGLEIFWIFVMQNDVTEYTLIQSFLEKIIIRRNRKWRTSIHEIIRRRYADFPDPKVEITDPNTFNSEEEPMDETTQSPEEDENPKDIQYRKLRFVARLRWKVSKLKKFRLEYFEQNLQNDSVVRELLEKLKPYDRNQIWIWIFQSEMEEFSKFNRYYYRIVIPKREDDPTEPTNNDEQDNSQAPQSSTANPKEEWDDWDTFSEPPTKKSSDLPLDGQAEFSTIPTHGKTPAEDKSTPTQKSRHDTSSQHGRTPTPGEATGISEATNASDKDTPTPSGKNQKDTSAQPVRTPKPEKTTESFGATHAKGGTTVPGGDPTDSSVAKGWTFTSGRGSDQTRVSPITPKTSSGDSGTPRGRSMKRSTAASSDESATGPNHTDDHNGFTAWDFWATHKEDSATTTKSSVTVSSRSGKPNLTTSSPSVEQTGKPKNTVTAGNAAKPTPSKDTSVQLGRTPRPGETTETSGVTRAKGETTSVSGSDSTGSSVTKSSAITPGLGPTRDSTTAAITSSRVPGIPSGRSIKKSTDTTSEANSDESVTLADHTGDFWLIHEEDSTTTTKPSFSESSGTGKPKSSTKSSSSGKHATARDVLKHTPSGKPGRFTSAHPGETPKPEMTTKSSGVTRSNDGTTAPSSNSVDTSVTNAATVTPGKKLDKTGNSTAAPIMSSIDSKTPSDRSIKKTTDVTSVADSDESVTLADHTGDFWQIQEEDSGATTKSFVSESSGTGKRTTASSPSLKITGKPGGTVTARDVLKQTPSGKPGKSTARPGETPKTGKTTKSTGVTHSNGGTSMIPTMENSVTTRKTSSHASGTTSGRSIIQSTAATSEKSVTGTHHTDDHNGSTVWDFWETHKEDSAMKSSVEVSSSTGKLTTSSPYRKETGKPRGTAPARSAVKPTPNGKPNKATSVRTAITTESSGVTRTNKGTTAPGKISADSSVTKTGEVKIGEGKSTQYEKLRKATSARPRTSPKAGATTEASRVSSADGGHTDSDTDITVHVGDETSKDEQYRKLRLVTRRRWKISKLKKFRFEYFEQKLQNDSVVKELLEKLKPYDKNQIWIWVYQTEMEEFSEFRRYYYRIVKLKRKHKPTESAANDAVDNSQSPESSTVYPKVEWEDWKSFSKQPAESSKDPPIEYQDEFSTLPTNGENITQGSSVPPNAGGTTKSPGVTGADGGITASVADLTDSSGPKHSEVVPVKGSHQTRNSETTLRSSSDSGIPNGRGFKRWTDNILAATTEESDTGAFSTEDPNVPTILDLSEAPEEEPTATTPSSVSVSSRTRKSKLTTASSSSGQHTVDPRGTVTSPGKGKPTPRGKTGKDTSAQPGRTPKSVGTTVSYDVTSAEVLTTGSVPTGNETHKEVLYRKLRLVTRIRWEITKLKKFKIEYFEQKLQNDSVVRELLEKLKPYDRKQIWIWVYQNETEEFSEFKRYYYRITETRGTTESSGVTTAEVGEGNSTPSGKPGKYTSAQPGRTPKSGDTTGSHDVTSAEGGTTASGGDSTAPEKNETQENVLYSKLRLVTRLRWAVTKLKKFKIEYFEQKLQNDSVVRELLEKLKPYDRKQIWIWVYQNETEEFSEFKRYYYRITKSITGDKTESSGVTIAEDGEGKSTPREEKDTSVHPGLTPRASGKAGRTTTSISDDTSVTSRPSSDVSTPSLPNDRVVQNITLVNKDGSKTVLCDNSYISNEDWEKLLKEDHNRTQLTIISSEGSGNNSLRAISKDGNRQVVDILYVSDGKIINGGKGVIVGGCNCTSNAPDGRKVIYITREEDDTNTQEDSKSSAKRKNDKSDRGRRRKKGDRNRGQKSNDYDIMTTRKRPTDGDGNGKRRIIILNQENFESSNVQETLFAHSSSQDDQSWSNFHGLSWPNMNSNQNGQVQSVHSAKSEENSDATAISDSQKSHTTGGNFQGSGMGNSMNFEEVHKSINHHVQNELTKQWAQFPDMFGVKNNDQQFGGLPPLPSFMGNNFNGMNFPLPAPFAFPFPTNNGNNNGNGQRNEEHHDNPDGSQSNGENTGQGNSWSSSSGKSSGSSSSGLYASRQASSNKGSSSNAYIEESNRRKRDIRSSNYERPMVPHPRGDQKDQTWKPRDNSILNFLMKYNFQAKPNEFKDPSIPAAPPSEGRHAAPKRAHFITSIMDLLKPSYHSKLSTKEIN